MTENPEWIFFRDLVLDDPKNNRFNIDTRDFHAGYFFDKKPHKDFETIKKYPEFFHTKQEVEDLLERYYSESGGEGEWRYFDLEVKDPTVNNWKLKYLRIYRTDLGFVVCNSDDRAIRKSILEAPVGLEHLSRD